MANFDDPGDNTITAAQYLEDVVSAEEEADLVLGADDGDTCTYNHGYLPRQAVFSCLTCTPKIKAGFCVACSLHCHEGHQVEELYTRRNFRCDCGNSKFGDIECKLFPKKDPENKKNEYNQNYAGKYCSCSKPYPDPEREATEFGDDMIQCCICEDWFHEKHLGLDSNQEAPKDEEGLYTFEDLVCAKCAARCSFLKCYPNLHVKPLKVPSDHAKLEIPQNKDSMETSNKEHTSGLSQTDVVKGDDGGSCLHSNGSTTCKIFGKYSIQDESHSNYGPIFFPTGWRSALCVCVKCKRLYEESNVSFLLREADTIASYEEQAKRKREQHPQPLPMDRALNAFMAIPDMSHVQKVEIITGFNDMSAKMKEFLRPFSQSGEIVTAEAISSFFEDLTRKRRKLHV